MCGCGIMWYQRKHWRPYSKWLGVVQMNRYHSCLSPHVPTEFLCLGFFCTTCGKRTTFQQFPGTLETSSRSSTSCSMTLGCLGYSDQLAGWQFPKLVRGFVRESPKQMPWSFQGFGEFVGKMGPRFWWFMGSAAARRRLPWSFRNPSNSPVEVGSLSHALQSFIHPRWLFGISQPSTVFPYHLAILVSWSYFSRSLGGYSIY